MELLDHLLSRGDLVALDSGRLIIQPASGAKVPASWLETHGDALALTIAIRANTPLFKYVGFTVGAYGEYKADGVTLQFVNMATGEEVYAVFNVNRARVQNNPKGKTGTKLPAKQFRITKKMGLYKFWLRTGLAEPEAKYLSEFHRVMGRLKSVLFTMSVSGNKADKSTIQAATVASMGQNKSRGKVGGKTGEEMGKSEGKTIGTENPARLSYTGLTGASSYVSDKVRLKLIRKEGVKEALTASIGPYSPAVEPSQTLITDESFRYVPVHLQSNEEWLAEYDTGSRTIIRCDDERWDQCIEHLK